MVTPSETVHHENPVPVASTSPLRCVAYVPWSVVVVVTVILQVPKDKQWLCPVCTVMLHKGQTLFSHQTEVEKAKRSQYPPPTVRLYLFQQASLLRVPKILTYLLEMA